MKRAFRLFVATLLAIPLISTSFVAQAAGGLPPRPPQYVLLAFDGSLNLDMWDETYTFARQNDINFTYFMSGVYFLMNQNKNEYDEPTHGRGKSSIGFGGTSPDRIAERVAKVNRSFDHGDEMGSHINGHYDGTKWTLAEWKSDFKQFYHLIFDAFKINNIVSKLSNPFHFDPAEVKGFRAPLLGRNPAMYDVLRDLNYNYDTSKTAPMNYWPEKQNTVWNFPLAMVTIAGTGKRTLSMDYNFYYSQSAGKPRPDQYSVFKKQMLDTYLGYFGSNYHGNRAPVHIGHHFSKWNGGAYWDAMKEFAQTVCRLPEVKCVTYREYTKYLESLPPSTLAQYRRGQFDRTAMPVHIASLEQKDRSLDADVKLAADETGSVSAQLSGSQADLIKASTDVRYRWSVDGQEVAQTTDAKLNLAPYSDDLNFDSKLQVKVDYRGQEVLSSTQKVTDFTETETGFNPVLSDERAEDKSLEADPPEAHAEQDAFDGGAI